MAVSNILREVDFYNSSDVFIETKFWSDSLQAIDGGPPAGWSWDNGDYTLGPFTKFVGGYYTAVDYELRKMYAIAWNLEEFNETTSPVGIVTIDMDEGGLSYAEFTYDRAAVISATTATSFSDPDSPTSIPGTNYITICGDYNGGNGTADYLLVDITVPEIVANATTTISDTLATIRFPAWLLPCTDGDTTVHFGIYPSGRSSNLSSTSENSSITIVKYDTDAETVTFITEDEDIGSDHADHLNRHYDVPQVRQGRTSATETGSCSFFMSDKINGKIYEFTIPFDAASWSDITIEEVYEDAALAVATSHWPNSYASHRPGINSFYFDESQDTIVFNYNYIPDTGTAATDSFLRLILLADQSTVWQTDDFVGTNWFVNAVDHQYRYVPCTVGCFYKETTISDNQLRIIELATGTSFIVHEDFSAPIFTPPEEEATFYDGQEDFAYFLEPGFAYQANPLVDNHILSINGEDTEFVGSFALRFRVNTFFSGQLICAAFSGDGIGIAFGEEKDPNYIDFASSGTSLFESFFDTGYAIRAEGHKDFQTNYITTYSKAPESFVVDNNGDYVVDSDGVRVTDSIASSCLLTGKWDWSRDILSGRWTPEQQIYNNIDRPFRTVQHRKLKLRGSGSSLQLHFKSEEGKPFHIVGWSTFDTAEEKV